MILNPVAQPVSFLYIVFQVTAVEVEGTIVAGVTQTCVRTNEDFDVDLEFSLFALVRPVAPLFDDLQEDVNLTESKSFEEDVRSKKGKEKKDSKALDVPERNVNAIDILELQRLLQDLDTEDDVIEDESIYSLDGVIGESNARNAPSFICNHSQHSHHRLRGAVFATFLAQTGSVSKKAWHLSYSNINHWISLAKFHFHVSILVLLSGLITDCCFPFHVSPSVSCSSNSSSGSKSKSDYPLNPSQTDSSSSFSCNDKIWT
jgi:hypothetical protein